jgi:ATP sulfurylase
VCPTPRTRTLRNGRRVAKFFMRLEVVQVLQRR